jgi:hypothetical protein
MASWKIAGTYMETCNCAFLCPCITSNLSDTPTEGDCKAAVALQIDKGEMNGVNLDGMRFVVLLRSPGAMSAGDITAGLIVDERANDKQQEALLAIATGAAGGPMAGLAPLIAKFAGVERRPISFERDGLNYSVKAGELVVQSLKGVPSATAPGEALAIDNGAHPANKRLSLAKATHSAFHAFGIDWDDSSGTRNGHFAPFSWAA